MNPPGFESFAWRSFEENVSRLLAEAWMLVTPGLLGSADEPIRWNTMTASWGGFGHLWNMDVAFVFVRPSRHSYGFMERSEGFALSFFDEGMRSALALCGARSGRDTDKAKAAGISPLSFGADEGARRVGFAEARVVLSCRKVFAQDLDPDSFIDPAIIGSYPAGDVHRLYIGALEGAWKRAAPRD